MRSTCGASYGSPTDTTALQSYINDYLKSSVRCVVDLCQLMIHVDSIVVYIGPIACLTVLVDLSCTELGFASLFLR
eukprot:210641-Amphidinium_carterae.2